jgi:hypothetical protein
MKFKFLKQFILGSMLLLATNSYAGLITVDEWHGTNDNFSGLKQSQFSDDVYFAVSKTGVFDYSADYEMLEGFRQATWDEYWSLADDYIALNGLWSATYNYYSKGGWAGYNFEGINRYYLSFADEKASNSKYVIHTGNYDNYRGTQYTLTQNQWAGFVLIKSTDVPEPSTLAIFALGIMGLAARRFKKQS